jgi:Cytochrome c3
MGMLAVWAAMGAQPVAYSHKQHLAMGLECLDCHSSADTSAAATIPSVRKCMLCHAKVGTSKPEVKKLMAYAASKREIPWERLYGFPKESMVKFQHAPHVRAKIECGRCHGDMTQATTAQRVVNHTMGTCLSCHRQYKASEDCASCHY